MSRLLLCVIRARPQACLDNNVARSVAWLVTARLVTARLVTVFVLALLALPIGVALAQTTEKTLANGVKIVVKEDRRAPTVVHMAWYRAGSIDEVNGKTGVAHVLEHMMFKATKTLATGEFSKRVARLGGRENAFTSREYTGYYQQLHKSGLVEVMTMEADRMANLVLTREEFEKEIKVVMEERRWRTEDRATSLLFEQFMASAFISSPVRAPIVGWMSDLEAMTVDDAREWYDQHYLPNNAVIVVAGDVSAEEVFRIAESTYGRLPGKAAPVRKPQEEPEQKGTRRVSLKAPAENPYLLVGFRVPKLVDVEKDNEPYALEMLSSVLAADESSRLTVSLVRGSRVANRAGASYDMTTRGPSLFVLDGVPADGKSVEELERALRGEIARIARDGVREDELRRIKAQYVAGQIFRRDSLMSQAMEIGGLEAIGHSWRAADRMLERIKEVTPAQVQAVAAKYFSDDTMTVANLIPQPIGAKRAPPPGLRH